jgi:hypothetical protein
MGNEAMGHAGRGGGGGTGRWGAAPAARLPVRPPPTLSAREVATITLGRCMAFDRCSIRGADDDRLIPDTRGRGAPRIGGGAAGAAAADAPSAPAPPIPFDFRRKTLPMPNANTAMEVRRQVVGRLGHSQNEATLTAC